MLILNLGLVESTSLSSSTFFFFRTAKRQTQIFHTEQINGGKKQTDSIFFIHGSIPTVCWHQGLDNAFVYIFVFELILRVVTERRILREKVKGCD